MSKRSKFENAELTADDRTLVVTIPFNMHRRGGKKVMVTPHGHIPWAPTVPCIDNTLLRALARAHRWKRMLDRGDYATIREIEKTEKVTNSFVSRLLRLTLLAPKIVEALLDGQQPKTLQLEDIVYGVPVYWPEQQRALGVG